MRLSHSSIPIFTYFICLSLYQSPVNPATPDPTPKALPTNQANSAATDKQLLLKANSKGQDVQTLQTQLKELGYYKGAVDGQYGESTQIAVSKFQKAKGLVADGIAGKETRDSIQAAVIAKTPSLSSPTPSSKPQSSAKSSQGGFIWWSLLGLGILGSIGAILYLVRRFGQHKPIQQFKALPPENEIEADKNKQLQQSETSNDETEIEADKELVNQSSSELDTNQPMTASISTKLLPLEQTSRLAKLSVVDELIQDLHSSDPSRRRKAIWDLGQQGDSRAIQPLLDLMMNVDSQQRSLILAAVGEISTRTLKPMNRALAISLQDESPQVRQNAIRDLTRVYDMMSQISQILCHALEDPDAEVQSTAKYALNQMNRIRIVPEQQSPPAE